MIIQKIEELRKLPGNYALTIGTFDGVHLGHKKVLDTLVEEAKKSDLSTLVVTFTNNPKEVITGEKVIPVITPDEKLERIEDEGIDVVLGIPFTEEIQKQSKGEFLHYLGVSIKKMIIGYDFNFGNKVSTLPVPEDLETLSVEALRLDGDIVSSTRIREYMKSGEMEKLRSYLGRPYRHSGTVVHGKNVGGRLLGYPTTNVTINDSVYALRSGVYVTKTYLVDEVFESVTNIGKIPTFQDRPFSVETHILDFKRSIYGQEVKIEFIHFLRPEIKYDHLEDLVAQIKKDVDDTRHYYESHPEERIK